MFKITIEEIQEVTTMKHGNYCVIGERLYTAAEINEFENYLKPKDSEDIAKQNTNYPIKKEYGYPPKIETTETTNVKMYEQVVDSLNIQAVITAVNAISFNNKV